MSLGQISQLGDTFYFLFYCRLDYEEREIGKRGRKRMDDREKEGEVKERVEVPELPEEGVERREEEIEESQAIREAVAGEEERCEEDPECILQPRELGCVPLLQTLRKFPLWNLSSNTLNCMTRNIHVSMTEPEERLSGQKYLQNSSSSPLM